MNVYPDLLYVIMINVIAILNSDEDKTPLDN